MSFSFFGALAAAAVLLLYFYEIAPRKQYDNALQLAEEGKYEEAVSMMEEIPDYKDSVKQLALIEAKQIEANMPDYDFGTVIESPQKADFNVFYDMLKSETILWQALHSFVSAETDTQTLVCNVIFKGSMQYGVHRQFDLPYEYVPDPNYTSSEDMTEMEICRYNAGDIDWVLKAVFDKTPVHFKQNDESALYYEGEYFYRSPFELYAGEGYTEVVEFSPSYEEIKDNVYKFSIDITTSWEYGDGNEQFKWEFVATPMKSKDFGTYWKIISFTQLSIN